MGEDVDLIEDIYRRRDKGELKIIYDGYSLNDATENLGREITDVLDSIVSLDRHLKMFRVRN